MTSEKKREHVCRIYELACVLYLRKRMIDEPRNVEHVNRVDQFYDGFERLLVSYETFS